MNIEVYDRRQKRRIKQQRKRKKQPFKTGLVGQKFGLLTVLRHYAGEYWECRCDCGNEKSVSRPNLKSGSTKSCGCQRHIITPERRANIRRAAKAKNERMTPEQRSENVKRGWVKRRLNAKAGITRKRYRVPTAKPGQLKINYAIPEPGEPPDVVFTNGEKAPRCDLNLLMMVIGHKRQNVDWGPDGKEQITYDPPLLEELEKRGYDLTTIQFSIFKKGHKPEHP